MYELGRLVGMICGIVVGLIVCLVALKLMNKNKKIKTEYDERQRAIRDRGYFFGYWVLLAIVGIVSLLESSGFEVPLEPFTKFFSEFFISACVVCVYTILKGAYFGINNIKKRYYIFMIVAAAVNFASFIAAVIFDGFIVDGIVCAQFANLLAGILFLFIAAAIVIKNAMDKKADEEDDYEES